MFKSVCDMMELYLDYFEKGHKMLRKLIPSLMKYRAMIASEVQRATPHTHTRRSVARNR